MSRHFITNFEIRKCYQNESRFKGVYSRNTLPKIKDGAYVINTDKYKSIKTHWTALFVKDDNGSVSSDPVYLVSLEFEHIPK